MSHGTPPPFYIKASCKEILAYSLQEYEALCKAFSIGVLHFTSLDEDLAIHQSKQLKFLLEELQIPFIIEKDVSSVKKNNAGGFCVDISTQEEVPTYSISRIRKQLGAGPVFGVDCGSSRDHAMQAGEEGADYIIFSTLTEEGLKEIAAYIEWWGTHTILPCVASGPMRKEHMHLFEKADFIMPHFSYIHELFAEAKK